ncbi:MAG: ABC transporter permease [Bacillota bacterium]|nr:ABC transporter permease [Bacillota bacterium]
MLAKNELFKTYKGAVIGPFWAIVKPIFTLFVFWFAMELGLRGGMGKSPMGQPYFIFLMVGFVPWFFINDTILLGARSIRLNSQFVTKVSFPISTIMTFTTLARMFVNLFLTLLMCIVLICTGYHPSLYNLQFFYYAPLMFLFFVALCWSTAPMSAFSKDFESLITSIMAGFFWLTGIVYYTGDIKIEWVKQIMYFNPCNYFVNGYRYTFFGNQMPSQGSISRWFFGPDQLSQTIIFFVEFAFIILLGIHNYNRLRRKLPDVL